MYTVPKLWPHKRVITQCKRSQSYDHTKGRLHNVHGAKAIATQKGFCTMYTVPKLWHTKRWQHKVHGAKAMATQKSDCPMYTVPKLWPHKRVIAQCTRCQSHGHTKGWLHNAHGAKAMATQKPTAQSPTTVSNAENHTILKVEKT
jgi:hypothetical protein